MIGQTENTEKPAEEKMVEEKRVFELAIVSLHVVKIDELTEFEEVLIGCGNEISVGRYLDRVLNDDRKNLKAEKKFEFVLPRI